MFNLSSVLRAIRPRLLAPLLVLPLAGFTNCDSFTPVTIPASDTSPPITYDGVWDLDYLVGAASPSSFTFHLDRDHTVLAVSSTLDGGGARKLDMFSSSTYTCCTKTVCRYTTPVSAPQTDQQNGSVGSKVSNGMYVYAEVTVPSCPTGYTLQSFRFSWYTRGEDFYGNRTTGKTQSIVYP